MKLPAVPLLFASALVLAAEDAPSLTGRWQVHNNIVGNESDQACNLTQTKDEVTGTCSSRTGEVKITGKVDGKKITWSYKSEYGGSPLTVNYEGKFEAAGKIAGTVNVPEFSADGDFTAVRSN